MKNWFKWFVFSAVFTTSTVYANISQWSIGGAASYSPAVYKDTPSNKTVIPMIGYEGSHFFLRGFSAGYRMLPVGSPQNIVFRVVYDPRTLKPEDSDDPAIQLMDERKASILGGVSYQMITLAGMFEITAGSDLRFVHNGLYAEAAWRLPIRRRGWAVTPAIGYAYNSSRLNDHLYGVSSSEANKAQAAGHNIEEFEASWDGQYFIGLSGYMHLTPHIRVTGGIRYTNLEGEVQYSPLVENGVYTSANVGVAYVF
ncbi:MipA/OmpV family protein [Vibrio atypicus]|uniref:MipA/OmpV family protein n=1 Tax=Vibrio atypicus TaxID=558271 RepID=UPI0013576496|nr:MipA/OmpV family protein [Vibrio atypicus]